MKFEQNPIVQNIKNTKLPLFICCILLLFLGCSKENEIARQTNKIDEARALYDHSLAYSGANTLFDNLDLSIAWTNFKEVNDSTLVVQTRQIKQSEKEPKIVGNFELYFDLRNKNDKKGYIRYTLPCKEPGRKDYIAYSFQGRVIMPKKSAGKQLMASTNSYYKQVVYAIKQSCPAGLYFDTQMNICNWPQSIFGDTTPMYWKVQFEGEDFPRFFLAPLDNASSSGYDGEDAHVVAFPEYFWSGGDVNPYQIINPDYKPGGGSGSGGGGGGSSGGGGSGGSTTPSATNFLAAQPAQSINLAQRLLCFNAVPTNASTTYKITIHAHSAIQGLPSAEFNLPARDPGHAYITLEKANGSNVQRLSFGFYPKVETWVTPTKNGVASGIGEEYANQYRRSDIRMTRTLTNAEFTSAVSSASSNGTKTYDLNDYNCTDFALEVFNASQSSSNQLNVPNSNIGFTTPAGLYKKLDELRVGGNQNVSNTSGRPPISTSCN